MELSKEQIEIVESPEHKIVVMSAAASGKTTTLVERVRWVLKHGGNPNKMVCITFTNNAADEMRSRLGNDYKDGLFIGTVHGYANYLLRSHNIDTTYIRNNEDFDELFGLVMENPSVVQPIGFLALDEAQDSSDKQFDFIFGMLQPTAFIIFGDTRQSIFRFSGSNPKLMMNLARQEGVTTYNMIQNHRNGSEIIGYSNWILSKMKSVLKTPVRGTRNEPGLVTKIGASKIIPLIQKDGNYGDWAILCRTNAKISAVLGQLKAKGIPAITFRQAQGSNAELKEKLHENSVKVLTIHSAKGLEWPKVIVADQQWSNEEALRLMYTAATRARDELYWVQGY